VTSAGTNIAGNSRNFKNMTQEGWDDVVAINLNGLFYCCHAVIPGMRKRKDGLIINISSWAGRYASSLTARPTTPPSAPVIAVSESINMEECMHGIRATSILPGEVATADPAQAAGAALGREQARMAQPDGLRQGDPVRRDHAGAQLRQRAGDRADLEPLLRRRPRSAQDLIFWRVTLPFLAGYFVSYVYRSVNALIGPEIAREFGLTAAAWACSPESILSRSPRSSCRSACCSTLWPAARQCDAAALRRDGGLWFALAPSAGQLIAARRGSRPRRLGVPDGFADCVRALVSDERMATMNGVAFASGMLGATCRHRSSRARACECCTGARRSTQSSP
jgi:hypothetical protein